MGARRIFGYTDIHWADRDEEALEVAKQAQTYFKPHVTVIGGDLLNCEPFSRHPRTKVSEEVAERWEEDELIPANKFLDWVQARTLDTTEFLEGNHEEWIERYLVGSGLGGVALGKRSTAKQLLGGRRSRFNWTPFTELKQGRQGVYSPCPRLAVVHGWCATRHAAARHLELSRSRSVIYHHTHRAQHEISRDPWTGRIIEAFSAGCLCKLQPIYAHNGSPTQWSHGIWVAYIGKRGDYTAYPVSISKGSAVLPDGKEIRV